MEPEKVVPYFGTVEKPECHMFYNADDYGNDLEQYSNR